MRTPALLTLACAAILAGCGSSSKSTTTASTPSTPQAAPSLLSQRLTEMKITGSSPTAAAGKVGFAVVNAGKVPHEMVVIRTPTPAGKLPTDSQGRASEKGNVGETGDMGPGARKVLKLTLKPGHYALICNLPGHYKAGMYADLTVK